MHALILDSSSVGEFEEPLERRRRSGLDRLDEVWDGALHMVRAPSGEHAYVAHQMAVLLGPLEADRQYRPVERSDLIALGADALERIDWP